MTNPMMRDHDLKPSRACRHPHSQRQRINHADWDLCYDCNICRACGHWLSLGESDETDPRVAVEIFAARIAADDGRCGDFTAWNGWHAHATGEDDHSMGIPEWHAGYLARCIATHSPEKESP